MFIRKQGRRWVLLHSHRDGAGRVYHRRLGHCFDAAELEQRLADLSLRCPEIRFDRAKLLVKIQNEVQPSRTQISDRTQRVEKIRRSARALLRLLAEEEDTAVLEGAQNELALLSARLQKSEEIDEVQRHQSRLSPRRRQFDHSDPQIQPYLEALDKLEHKLQEQSRFEECLTVLGRRVEYCPTPEAQIRYGALLQSEGRTQEAIQQYARLPNRDPQKHYNLASAALQEGRKEEALTHLLRGLTHDPKANQRFDLNYAIRIMSGQNIPPDELKPVGPNPAYWDRYGHLWTTEGQNFVQRICSQPLVRSRLRKARETGVRVRNLIPPSWQRRLLERAFEPDRQPGKSRATE